MSTGKRAAIYARYSSDKQNERSIDDQVALCRAYCERHDLFIVDVYNDRAISGASTANRPGWHTLMSGAIAHPKAGDIYRKKVRDLKAFWLPRTTTTVPTPIVLSAN